MGAVGGDVSVALYLGVVAAVLAVYHLALLRLTPPPRAGACAGDG